LADVVDVPTFPFDRDPRREVTAMKKTIKVRKNSRYLGTLLG
jgi:hypothetical protein